MVGSQNLLLVSLVIASFLYAFGRVVNKDELSKKSVRHRRSEQAKPEKIMELMIVADKYMIDRYGKDQLRKILADQANMLRTLFRDKSLSYPVTVAVTRTVMLETDEFAGAATIYKLLDKFSDWVVKNNPVSDSDPNHVDNAVLLTKDGCADGCTITGLAFNGICGRGTSQAVVKFRGLLTPITMAHEIGHTLGLGHDGGSTGCPNGVNIMSSGAGKAGNSFEWSKCSSKKLETILKSSASKCFDDKPQASLPSSASNFQLYGKVYDKDSQCRMEFGRKYTRCNPRKDRCDILYCKRPNENYCDMSNYPVAHGSSCGVDKWCIYGECVRNASVPVTPAPIDGGWSDYSQYTSCNRPCGGGVQWKTRTCTNPAPKYGGKNCVGATKAFWKTCNMQACPSGTKTFRQEQCQAITPGSNPILDAKMPCRLICSSPAGSAIFRGNVKDGTVFPGTYNDICIEGVLRKVGCDTKLESGALPDRCNICDGDGSTCEIVKGKNTEPYAWEGHYEIATIPKGATNIVVEEMGPSEEFLGVKVGDSANLAYNLPDWSKRVKVAGTDLQYTMNDYAFADKIEMKGPINDKIRIIFVNLYYTSSKGVKWQYSKPADGKTSSSEYAVAGAWGKCSKTCAGGTQTRKIVCKRTDDKSQIGLRYCPSSGKPATTQSCNTQACPPSWVVHSWSACSKPCGKGERTRSITCSELRSDNKLHTVDESKCKTAKPTVAVKEVCNAIKCLAKRVIGEWGQCSTSCGKGTKTRKVTCKRVNGDGTVTVTRDLECDAILEPVKKVDVCNLDKPCSGWEIKYKTCSKTCGGGVKAPYAACGLPDTSSCPADQKPDVSKITPISCNTHSCVTYAYKAVPGPCSVTCGAGTRSMSVKCYSSENAAVSDAHCEGKTKPDTTPVPCSLPACPTYAWVPTYGSCVKTCGTGYKSMILHCQDNSGNHAPISKCMKSPIPSQQKCEGLPPCEGKREFIPDLPNGYKRGSEPSESENDVDLRSAAAVTIPKYYGLGCFKDGYKRLVPVNLGSFRSSINWNDMTSTVNLCAQKAAGSYSFFALQFYGECWAGHDSVSTSYYMNGPSKNCYNGTGGEVVNYVYHFGPKTEPSQLSPIIPFGCYSETHTAGPPLVMIKQVKVDKTKPLSQVSAEIVSKCAIAAANRGDTIFGTQSNGKCWSAPAAETSYASAKAETTCASELGGANSHYVYKFITFG